MNKQKINEVLKKNKVIIGVVIAGVIIAAVGTGCYFYKKHVKHENQLKAQARIEAIHKEDIEKYGMIPEKLKPSVLESKDPTIQKLVKESTQYPKLTYILNNQEKYPKDLIELAARHSETIDFVYNYPMRNDHKPVPVAATVSGKIPLYIQWDQRWGYDKYGDSIIALAGCGADSVAMVASGITGDMNITPNVVAKYAEDNGYYEDGAGTKWSLFGDGVKHFGIRGQLVPINAKNITRVLKEGHPIIVSAKPGIFTTTGHIMVLRGITKDGKILLSDPDSIANSEKPWDVNVIISQIVSMWEMLPYNNGKQAQDNQKIQHDQQAQHDQHDQKK